MENSFLNDFVAGLEDHPKRISSKYLYDDMGSSIFQEIMRMPTYYLTDCELEIFKTQSKQLVEQIPWKEKFKVIELGAGDGSKTSYLIKQLIEANCYFEYKPIDISEAANNELCAQLKDQFPTLEITPETGDYFTVLKEQKMSQEPILLLFLGGNIGNYGKKEAINLLELFNKNLKQNDFFLLGADLMKNPLIVHQAYQDPYGITKRFNLNLLTRANRELGANFQLDHFDFYCYYNPENGDLKSYLISLRDQKVFIEKANKTFHFKWNEIIWTERSRKYSLDDLIDMGNQSGFKTVKQFLDCKHYFTDCLFVKV